MTSSTLNGSGSAGDCGDAAWRQRLWRACAEATEAELEAALAGLGELPAAEEIRPPQTGLVMLQGRIGGSGPPFNVGEATVTRAAVRLGTGAVGFSYLIGRSHRRARLAALIDALGLESARRQRLEALLVAPVMARLADAKAKARAETAATRVDFFTLVRGED
jgi:alpha-D-ribose 1-methylphosphonate 5-triphosphate synthase subunit PhnG